METIVACHATQGDGSVNWYVGPVGPITRDAVKKLNDHWPGMFVIDPDDKPEPGDCGYCSDPIKGDRMLAETLVWWANGAPDEDSSFEFNPLV